jgi:hypothetical protein
VVPQRDEPAGEGVTEKHCPLVMTLRGAIECRPPFDKAAAAVDDRRNPQRRTIVLHRHRRGAAKFVNLRAVGIGQSNESLPDALAPVEHVAYRADRVAGFAVLDPAFAGAVDPDRVVVEIPNRIPDIVGGLREHSAVIGLGHNRSLPAAMPMK